jgi:hypothetical protein
MIWTVYRHLPICGPGQLFGISDEKFMRSYIPAVRNQGTTILISGSETGIVIARELRFYPDIVMWNQWQEAVRFWKIILLYRLTLVRVLIFMTR